MGYVLEALLGLLEMLLHRSPDLDRESGGSGRTDPPKSHWGHDQDRRAPGSGRTDLPAPSTDRAR
jgi:hypothetical protein